MDAKAKRVSSLSSDEQSTDFRPSKTRRTSSPPFLGKVCLICFCTPRRDESGVFALVDESADHCLFLFDLDDDVASSAVDDDSYFPKNPELCFSSADLDVSGFFVIGTSLYLFGKKERLVYAYDFSSKPQPPSPTLPSSSSALPLQVMKLAKDDLSEVTPMKFDKSDPIACQTPDGRKMIVFSSILYVGKTAKSNHGAFELFDPFLDGGSWKDLPNVRPLMRDIIDSRDYVPYRTNSPCIMSYSFVDNDHVLLISTELGNFTLDFNNLPGGWSRCSKYRYPYGIEQPYMLVRDGFCLTEWTAWQDEPGPRYPFLSYAEYPPIANTLYGYYCSDGRGITWLTSSSLVCTLRGLVDEETVRPHLIVDVYDFDSKDDELVKRDLVEMTPDRLLPVKSVKTFKFLTGPQRIIESFVLLNLFPIPPVV